MQEAAPWIFLHIVDLDLQKGGGNDVPNFFSVGFYATFGPICRETHFSTAFPNPLVAFQVVTGLSSFILPFGTLPFSNPFLRE